MFDCCLHGIEVQIVSRWDRRSGNTLLLGWRKPNGEAADADGNELNRLRTETGLKPCRGGATATATRCRWHKPNRKAADAGGELFELTSWWKLTASVTSVSFAPQPVAGRQNLVTIASHQPLISKLLSPLSLPGGAPAATVTAGAGPVPQPAAAAPAEEDPFRCCFAGVSTLSVLIAKHRLLSLIYLILKPATFTQVGRSCTC